MKNKLLLLLLAVATAFQSYAALNGNGFYRVQNYMSKRYIYVIDDKGSVNVSTTSADMGAITLWFDLDKAITDPASVIYVEKEGNDAYSYNFEAQGTSVLDIISLAPRVKPTSTGADTYFIYGTKSGTTKYLCDGEKGDPADWPEGVLEDNGKGEWRWWYFHPISATGDNYFAASPNIQANGAYYTTLYASFGMAPASQGMEIFYVKHIDVARNIAVIAPISGTVAPSTPILIKSSSSVPSNNRMNLSTSGTSVSPNQLKGVYFNNSSISHRNQLAYNPQTMRILGTDTDGSLAFITPQNLDFIPANQCYLQAPSGAGPTIKVMDQAEYDEYRQSLPTGINISATSMELTEGETATLTATLSPSTAKGEIVWTTSNAAVAAVSNGNVTAVAAGSATVTATCGQFSASCQVTVKPRIPDLASILLSSTTLNLTEGDRATLTATLQPQGAQGTVIWTTSNDAVATVSNGEVTAVAPGNAVITASVGAIKAECQVTVEARIPDLQSLLLNTSSLILDEGESFQLTAALQPQGAQGTVAWVSSDPSIVTVSPSGLVTAVAEGQAIITASVGDIKADCTVTVKRVIIPVSGVTLTPSSITLVEGEEATLIVTVIPEGADASLTWSSSKPAVATVSDNGLIKALTPGVAVIKATDSATGIFGSCEVTVNKAQSGITSHQTEDFRVTFNGSSLRLHGLPAGTHVEVYNIAGSKVYSGSATEIPLPSRGIYLLRVEGRTLKVAL